MGLIGFGPAWDLGRAIAGASRKSTRDRYATVTRRDPDGVTWGTIAGASGEVPLGGSLADAEVGDVVAVDWRGGVPVASGNATSPSVGARRVEGAVAPVRAASAAAQGAARAAQSVADAAQRVAEAVNQHFFADTSGIHVTEAAQDEWETSHSGANVLLNSAGQLFRDGLSNLLTLTTEGGARALTVWDGLGNAAGNIRAIIGETITLGGTGESHAVIDYHSLQLVDMDGNPYFHVSDLRDASGVAQVADSFVGDGDTSVFFLSCPAASTDYTVTVSDGSGGTVTKETLHILFNGPPSRGSIITVEYETESDEAKAYTIGTRGAGVLGVSSVVAGTGCVASGKYSYAEGWETTASEWASHAEGYHATASGIYAHAEGGGTASSLYAHAEGCGTASNDYAHAEGSGTTASGFASHAEGSGTIAASDSQTAIGKYNEEDANGDYALIIGNGTSDSARSNAFAVGWDGTTDLGPMELSDSASGVHVHGSNVSTASQTASASVYGLLLGGYDKDGNLRSYVKHADRASGLQGVQVETRRKVNGSNVYNGIELQIDQSGNRSVNVSDAAAWRSALGLNADDSWHTGSFSSPFSNHSGSSANAPHWRRDGNVVSFYGIATVTSQQADATRTLFTLPTGYRPTGANRYIGRMQGSGMNSWELSVTTGGEVRLERYGTTSAGALTANVWLPFSGTFVI